MKPWDNRPQEEANLLNPAFCALVLTASVQAYSEQSKKDMPFPLVFMILPIVLHKRTRESLPRDIRTSLPVWLQDNALARVAFYERLMSLKEYSSEATRFAVRSKILSMGDAASIATSLSKRDMDSRINKLTGEAKECVSKARLVGKWLAACGDASTVMAFWGIRP